MEKVASKEIRAHTGLRGIAALMVVLYHYRQNLTGSLNPDLYTGILASSHVFVDLFFILSGFIIALVYSQLFDVGSSLKGSCNYLRNRIARLYPLHLLTMLVSFAIIVGLHGNPASEMLPQILTHLFMIHGWGFHDAYILNYPSWSISVEFAAYLVFPLIVWSSRSPLSRLILLGAIVAAYGALEWFGFGLELHERWPLARGIPGFALGVLLFRWRHITQNFLDTKITLFQMVAALLLLCLMHFSLNGTYLVVPMALLVMLTWEDRGKLSAWCGMAKVHFLGVLSYGIYLWHVPVRSLWYYAWPQLGVSGEFSPLLFVGLCVTTTVIAAALSYSFFELPARRWLRGKTVEVKRPVGNAVS